MLQIVHHFQLFLIVFDQDKQQILKFQEINHQNEWLFRHELSDNILLLQQRNENIDILRKKNINELILINLNWRNEKFGTVFLVVYLPSKKKRINHLCDKQSRWMTKRQIFIVIL